MRNYSHLRKSNSESSCWDWSDSHNTHEDRSYLSNHHPRKQHDYGGIPKVNLRSKSFQSAGNLTVGGYASSCCHHCGYSTEEVYFNNDDNTFIKYPNSYEDSEESSESSSSGSEEDNPSAPYQSLTTAIPKQVRYLNWIINLYKKRWCMLHSGHRMTKIGCA